MDRVIEMLWSSELIENEIKNTAFLRCLLAFETQTKLKQTDYSRIPEFKLGFRSVRKSEKRTSA
jgi:hypothetical protein